MTDIVCLYHTDHDGECSAAIALRDPYYQQYDCLAIPMNYHLAVPWDDLLCAKEILIFDFSLTPEDWHKLIKLRGQNAAADITWIDHHVTALAAAEGRPWDIINGTRRVGTAACALTWEHFRDEKMPSLVEHIADRDTWSFALGDATRYVHAALEAMIDTRPESTSWDPALDYAPTEHQRENANDEMQQLLRAGEEILRKNALRDAEYLRQWGFDVRFDGLRGCVCMGRRGSDVFISVAERYDVLIPTQYDGNTWNLTLYPGGRLPELDCAAIALKYGGGGHRGAAGLRVKEPPWEYVGPCRR